VSVAMPAPDEAVRWRRQKFHSQWSSTIARLERAHNLHAAAKTMESCFGRRANRYSDSIKPAAFGSLEPAFSSLRRVPASAPAIGRSFHAWPHALPRIRPLLAALSQLLFLFLESRFGSVTRPFSVGVQSRYSFSSESAHRTDFPA
jgi:hypothetical protein